VCEILLILNGLILTSALIVPVGDGYRENQEVVEFVGRGSALRRAEVCDGRGPLQRSGSRSSRQPFREAESGGAVSRN